MASSVILQNHHHNHHLIQPVNFNNRKNIINGNNNGVNYSGGSSNPPPSINGEYLHRQQQPGNGQQQEPQRPYPPKQDVGDVKKLEGVSSAPNSNNGVVNGKGNASVTRAVLASKYLVQFEDAALVDNSGVADANNNKNSISNKNTQAPPPSQLPHVGPTKFPLKCMKLATKEVMQCKITLRDDRGVSILAAHQRLGECSDYVNPISELIVHPKYFYLISPATFGNLHSYIYSKSSLKEAEAKSLFKQMVSIVNFCHSRGIVLRDLKLGRFVFTDKERTTIKLETLEDVAILSKPDSDDDCLDDRHGCPNYVSPEKTECVVNNGSVKYSGKCSDVWALGISLYAMLAGRYPFNENDCSRLLRKIRSCCYSPIDGISPFAKSLIRCLLAKAPTDRPSCNEILNHPWFRTEFPSGAPPTTPTSPVIRPFSAISRDVEGPGGIEPCIRTKRMRIGGDDDQVVPGS